jgi:hypothetical protein
MSQYSIKYDSDDILSDSDNNVIVIGNFKSHNNVNEEVLRTKFLSLYNMFSFGIVRCNKCKEESYRVFGNICIFCCKVYKIYSNIYNHIRPIVLDIRSYTDTQSTLYKKIYEEYVFKTDDIEDYTQKLICMVKQHIFKRFLFSAKNEPVDPDIILFILLQYNVYFFIPKYLMHFISCGSSHIDVKFTYRLFDQLKLYIEIKIDAFYDDLLVASSKIYIVSGMLLSLFGSLLNNNNYVLISNTRKHNPALICKLESFVYDDIAQQICLFESDIIQKQDNVFNFFAYRECLRNFIYEENRILQKVSDYIYDKTIKVYKNTHCFIQGYDDIWACEYFKSFDISDRLYFNIFVKISLFIEKYFSLNRKTCRKCNKKIVSHLYGKCIKCYVDKKLLTNRNTLADGSFKSDFLDISLLISDIDVCNFKLYNIFCSVIRKIINKIKMIYDGNYDIHLYVLNFHVKKHIKILQDLNIICNRNKSCQLYKFCYTWNDIFSLLILESNFFKENNIIIFREKQISCKTKYFDFLCIMDNVVFAIEIDDKSHNNYITICNDIEKNNIACQMDVKLIRIKIDEFSKKFPSYNELLDKFDHMCLQIKNIVNK